MSIKKILGFSLISGLGVAVLYSTGVFAADDLAGIATTITGTFKSLGSLMTGAAYVAGLGFTIAAIFKFKQHKDNPQQVQMGVPITMLLVGIALIFLPSIIQPAGKSIFGEGAEVGGFTGEGVNKIPGGGN